MRSFILSRHDRFRLAFLLILSDLILVHAGESIDPVVNFCRRVGHSSVFKNNTLYINGGIETFVDFGTNGQQDFNTITSGINLNLITVDMGSSWNWKTNVSISQKARRVSGAVEGMGWPVNVHDGALFGGPDESDTLYMFGGTTLNFNQSFPYYLIPPTEQYAMWQYDMSNDLWAAFDTSSSGITIPSWGANAEATNHGLAFYVGGQVDAGTANTTQDLGDDTVGLGGMVVLDTTSTTMKNLTVEDSVKSNRQGAGMVYVDNFGDAGVLILIGGRTEADGFLPMDEVAIFDVGTTDLSDNASADKNKWYRQKTSGPVPNSRTDFCLVAAPSQDNSSTNIYMYGGRSNGAIFDDIYVLSIPSFTWVKVFVGESARWSVTCHFIPPRQMITIGGGGDSTTDIAADCDWEYKSLAVLDMSTIGWSSTYDANAAPYNIPDSVVKVIGGSPQGNATKVQPTGGWGDDGLATLFTIRTVASDTSEPPSVTTSATSTPTISTASTGTMESAAKSISVGAIAGIAVGGVALIAIVAGGIFFFLRSRRNRRDSQHDIALIEKDGLPSYSIAASLSRAELVGTPQAAELSAKQSGYDQDGKLLPVEKDSRTALTPQAAVEMDARARGRSNTPIEME